VRFLHHFVSRRVVGRNVGEIDRPAALAAKLKRVLHYRHHAETEQVDFYDAEIFAVVLVPLRHDAARHRCVFQWHERAQFSLANDHATRVLAEMPRQTVDRLIQRDERGHSRMRLRQTGLLDLGAQVEGVREIAAGEQVREPVEDVRRKIQRFADLARGAAAAIRDDVRGHGSAVFAVTPVNFLDHALAPIAAGQIEIDVRPAFPAIAQEPLEDEIVADGIDRRNAEAITNRAVRRAAAALDHDVVFPAEIDDVPDDQEIAREPEPGDETEFFFQFSFHRGADGAVTLLRAEKGDGAEKRIHVVAVGNGKRREFVADVFERELEAIGETGRVFDGVESVGEERAHFGVALEMALGILGEEFARGIEMGVFADAGENVEDLAAIAARVSDAVCGDDGQAMLFCQIAELLVHALFAADEMALDFDVNIFAAEGVDKTLRAIRWTLGGARAPLLNSGSSLHFTAQSPFSLLRRWA